MFCPSCGARYESLPHYCKSCGSNLKGIPALLSGEFEDAEMAIIQEKHLKRILTGGVYSLAVVLAILWIIAFAVGQIKSDEFIPVLGIISWIATAIFLLNWGISRYKKKLDILTLNQAKRGASFDSADQPSIDRAPERQWLSPPLSVVEETTNLLPKEVKQGEKSEESAR